MDTDMVATSEDPRLAALLATVATRLDLGAGRRLCVQGARRQEFGRVISGRAKVVRDGAVVAWLGGGDHFGEFTVLRGLPSPVTIVTEGPTTVDVVTGSEFRGTIGADEGIRGSLERTLADRIRSWLSTPDPVATPVLSA
jgi:CRP-like cAMP-binding protein